MLEREYVLETFLLLNISDNICFLYGIKLNTEPTVAFDALVFGFPFISANEIYIFLNLPFPLC